NADGTGFGPALFHSIDGTGGGSVYCVQTQGHGASVPYQLFVRRVQPRRVRGLRGASAISRANRFTRCISSANRAMGCRRRIFNTSFRRRLSIINSLSPTGRTSAFPADEPSKTHDTDLGRMPTCPVGRGTTVQARLRFRIASWRLEKGL